MKSAVLIRKETSDEGTFGELVFDSGLLLFTAELTWRDNKPGKSCIPVGGYQANWRYSPKHGYCFHVDNVPNRTDVEIHSADFAGDVDAGFKCELLGCIAPGIEIGILEGQKAVINSKTAIQSLEAETNQQVFNLTIQEYYGK